MNAGKENQRKKLTKFYLNFMWSYCIAQQLETCDNCQKEIQAGEMIYAEDDGEGCVCKDCVNKEEIREFNAI